MKRHLILIAAITVPALIFCVSASVAEPLKWSAPISRYPNQWAPTTPPPQQYYGYPQNNYVDPYGYGMHGYGYGSGTYGYGGNYGPHPGFPRPGRGQFDPRQFSGNPYGYYYGR